MCEILLENILLQIMDNLCFLYELIVKYFDLDYFNKCYPYRAIFRLAEKCKVFNYILTSKPGLQLQDLSTIESHLQRAHDIPPFLLCQH